MNPKTSAARKPAAAYVRMSSKQQEKSPAEQRQEISRLAAREGYRIVAWFSDEAITGNSSQIRRPGLAALLSAANAGDFSTLLAWHTNRISREDPLKALAFFDQLRDAGVERTQPICRCTGASISSDSRRTTPRPS